MDEPWTLDWWSRVWIPAGLGLATLIVSGVSLSIALGAQRLARDAHGRETAAAAASDARERARERAELVREIAAWTLIRFPPEGSTLHAETHEWSRLASLLYASNVPNSTPLADRLAEVNRVLADHEREHGQDHRVRGSAGGITTSYVALWARDSSTIEAMPNPAEAIRVAIAKLRGEVRE